MLWDRFSAVAVILIVRIPNRPLGHDLAHERRHGISVDDILDRGAPVPFEASRRHVSSIGMGGPQAGSLRFTSTKIMGRLAGPAKWTCRRREEFSRNARVRPTKMGKTWQLGLVPAEPAP